LEEFKSDRNIILLNKLKSHNKYYIVGWIKIT